jgi:hypothetical protein
VAEYRRWLGDEVVAIEVMERHGGATSSEAPHGRGPNAVVRSRDEDRASREIEGHFELSWI